MTNIRRPRQPALLRASIIAATADLLADGLPVSIGAVADAAGVSKGAVQHHFSSREELFAALYDELCLEFESSQNRPPGESTPAWDYAKATLFSEGKEDATIKSWRALLIALVADRALAQRWAAWVEQNRNKAGPESTEQLAARLAADGLWLSDLLGIYKITGEERQRLALQIQQLAETKE